MTKTFKDIQESIAPAQLKRLKKEYEPLRKIDMSKHKGQVDKTTAMLSKLKIGTLIDLYKENIPWISDIAKSLVKKDKRFAHHVEEVELDEGIFTRHLTGETVARMMTKIKSMKPFAPKVARLRAVTRKDLEKILPDYISGGDITNLLTVKGKYRGEEVEEGFKSDAQRQDAVASLYRTLGLKGASKRSRDKAREKDKDKKKEEVEEGAE